MNKTRFFYYIPQIMVVGIVIVLVRTTPAYFPFNALRSTQMVRTVDSMNASGTLLTKSEIDLLTAATTLSPENCGAISALAGAYFSVAFPETDKGKNYNLDFNNQKGEYDEGLAARTVEYLDRSFNQCDSFAALFYKGYAYYLMSKPELALETLQSFVDLKPRRISSAVNTSTAFEIMSESYADLDDPLNAGLALIVSMSEGRKSNVLEDLHKVEQINQYLQKAQIAISPNHSAGMGRYSAVTRTDDQMNLFGVISGDPSILVYSRSGMDGIRPTSEVFDIDIGDYVWGSVHLNKAGDTDLAYLFGNRYIIYANSKDEFTEKVIIDSHTTTPSIVDQPGSAGLDSIQLTVDPQHQPHLIWSYGSGYIGYTVIKDGTADVSTIIASDAIFPDIEVSKDGIVSVVYNNLEPFPNQTTQVWYLEQRDHAWKKPVQISASEAWAGAASIVTDANGLLHVFYVTGTSPENTVLMHVWRDLQDNWQKPEVVGSQNYRPFIPATSDGSAVSFSGRTAPSLALLPDNRIVVVWRGSLVDGSTPIFGRELSNGKWQPTQVLGKILGQDFVHTQSIILKNDHLDVVSLIWSDNGELVFYDWKP